MRLLGKISKWFMIILGIVAAILLFMKSDYSKISCMFLMVNGIVAAIMMKKALYGVEQRNYIRYRLALEALNGAVLEWDSKERVLYLSSRLKSVLQTNVTIDTFEKLSKFVAEEDREFIISFFNEMIERKICEEFTLEFILITTAGESVVIECTGKGEIKDDIYFITGILLDINERRFQDELIRISERKYRRALEGSQDIMFYTNIENDEMVINGKIGKLLGIKESIDYKISGKDWINYIVESDRDIYLNAYNKFVEKSLEFITIEYRIKGKDKEVIWLRQRGKRIIEESGVCIYGSLSNITDNKEKERKIYYMGHFDEVTNVPNRRYFTEKAKRMLLKSKESEKDLAIIFMDIDNFKVINDTYGHDIGDKFLKMFCNKLNGVLDERCTLARFGGDEFIVTVEDIVYKGELIRILDNILNAFVTPINIQEKEIYCTVSIGVSTHKSDGDNIEGLLKKADVAMYRSKIAGKNQYFIYNDEISREHKREIALKKYLRGAINEHEIYFDLQPKYWSETGEIQGFECLSRWNHDELGRVSPVEFVKVAENTGLIVPLGNYLIEDAFKKSQILSELIGDNYKLAINLSQVQIRDDELVEFIKDRMLEYNINPRCIEFEVTESDIMLSPEKNIRNLKKIKELGVSISLDDFGTGYSSLNYLKMLPIDTVKIDKSFVDDIGIESKNEYIIEKIIELSHLLELEVVAEGVETKEQFDYLKDKNCDIIQGYYFSKPISFNEILKILHTESKYI